MELSSFTFNGVSCEEFGLKYAPDIRDMYIWKPVKSNIHQQTFDGHHGGYYYGATKQPKDITLRVFFEESKITEGILNRVESFYRVGTTGRLVFGRRPWIYYNATLINYDDSQLTNTYNGVITIQFRCFYPFGRSDLVDLDPAYELYDDVVANSMYATNISSTCPKLHTNLSVNTNFLLYNPGNEMADVAIEIQGTAGSGVTITNEATGQTCKITGITQANTTNVGKKFVCDSLNGFSYLTDGVNTEMKPEWHDLGFIQLAPATVIADHISATGTPGRNTLSGNFPSTMDSRSLAIVLDDQRIFTYGYINNNSIIVPAYTTNVQVTYTNIKVVQMNRILVRSASGTNITSLNFEYSPTFM